MDYGKATRIAAFFGKTCAICFGILGLFNPMMILIAAFIFFGAAAEARQVALREELRSFQARDGMRQQFRIVPAAGKVRDFASDLLEIEQEEFPVVRDDTLVGMARLDTALNAMEIDADITFSEVMRVGVQAIEEDEPLVQVLERAGNTFPVTSNGVLVGLLDVSRSIALATARARMYRQRDQPVDDRADLSPTTVAAAGT